MNSMSVRSLALGRIIGGATHAPTSRLSRLSRENPITRGNRRRYADLPKADHSRATSTGSDLTSNLPLIGIGALAACVPFYYFYHSGKAPNSEQTKQSNITKEKGAANQFRDPRDSPVKTLEDKKKKENS